MKNVEDVFPLSPMQELMLLHARAHVREDVLFNQLAYEIKGALDVTSFRAAWQQVVQRHPALRTFFLWQDLKRPLQIVRQQVELPFEWIDLRGKSDQERTQAIAALRRSDAAVPFDPAKAPLLRLKLIDSQPDSCILLWSSHHLIIDRWCFGRIYRDLFAAYHSRCTRTPLRLDPVRPFRDYLDWVHRQSDEAAETYWRSALAGFETPTLLTRQPDEGGSRGVGEALDSTRLTLSYDLSRSLRATARAHGVTLGVLVQGALALLLARLTRRDDVVFGATVSGRPADLPHVESIVGSFVNNLPVRIRLDPSRAIVDWLKSIQAEQQARGAFEYVSPAQLQQWSEVDAKRPLFDTLLVWLAPSPLSAPEGLEIRPLSRNTATAYPLTISVAESESGLSLSGDLQVGSRLECSLDELLRRLRAALQDLAGAKPSWCLCDLGLIAVHRDSTVVDNEQSILPAMNRFSRAVRGQPAEGVVNAAGRAELDFDLLVEMLQAEWSRLLGRSVVDLDAVFFDLGGTSISAARLHAAIEAHTRLKVPLMVLFQDPTIRKMAQVLSEQEWPLQTRIVTPLRSRGRRPPLFCVASPDVNTIGYALLAQRLSDDQPVFVLQAPPDSNRVRRLEPGEIEAVAATYVDAIRELQAVGPYQLLGMCTGAHLAMEMARQLSHANEEVGFVGIVNTWAHYTVSRLYLLARVLNRMDYYHGRLLDLQSMNPTERRAMLYGVLKRRIGAVPRVAAAALSDGAGTSVSADIEENTDPSPNDPWIEDFGWRRRERPVAKISCPVTVFRINRQPFWRIREDTMGWRKFAARVAVVRVSEDDHHKVLREPSVGFIAERLERTLQEVATFTDRERGQ